MEVETRRASFQALHRVDLIRVSLGQAPQGRPVADAPSTSAGFAFFARYISSPFNNTVGICEPRVTRTSVTWVGLHERARFLVDDFLAWCPFAFVFVL